MIACMTDLHIRIAPFPNISAPLTYRRTPSESSRLSDRRGSALVTIGDAISRGRHPGPGPGSCAADTDRADGTDRPYPECGHGDHPVGKPVHGRAPCHPIRNLRVRARAGPERERAAGQSRPPVPRDCRTGRRVDRDRAGRNASADRSASLTARDRHARVPRRDRSLWQRATHSDSRQRVAARRVSARCRAE